MPARTILSIQATPELGAITTASLHQIEHLVVPCIALCEGVLWPANAPTPELALAEEFGRFPDAWNGRPVVYGHPTVSGVAVSASHPSVLEDYAFGQIFNAKLKDNKLHMELWINEARAAELGDEVIALVDKMKAGDESVEISTGLFSMTEQVKGNHEGKTLVVSGVTLFQTI